MRLGCIATAASLVLGTSLPALAVFPTVQFRIVERTGQTQVTGADAVLDLAVQAKVEGMNLGQFTLNIAVQGEPESYGTLARGLINNTDGTYATTFGINGVVGRGGVARQFSWLPQISANFNGLINLSGGTFTNGPDQEIGNIAAGTGSSSLISTPGMDVDQDGNPDTWLGNGSGATPADQTRIPLDPSIASSYFANGQFVDIYRFRYTVNNFNARTLHFVLRDQQAGVFTELVSQSGTWGAYNSSHFSLTPTSTQALDIAVPTPAAGLPLAACAFAACYRRRR